MRKWLAYLLFGLLLIPGLFAQPVWRPLGGGLGNSAAAFYEDTVQNVLYVSGWFNYDLNGQFLGAIAKWDGNTWMALDSGTGCPNNVMPEGPESFQFVNGQLLAGGAQTFCQLGYTHYLHRWDGNEWQTAGPTDQSLRLRKANGQIFALGLFEVIDGDSARMLATWNGSNWEQVGDKDFFPDGHFLLEVAFYQGEYYFGGNFEAGQNGTVKEIVRWDGQQFIPPGGGIHGDSWVEDMAVYDSLLWVAGLFERADGNAGQHIMTWDGQQWADPFPDVYFTTQVRDLLVVDGVLYMIGYHYTFVDGAWRGPQWLARYDGHDFCSFGGESIYAVKLGSYQNRLIVGCGPTPNDTLHFIAEWMGGDDADWCVSQGPLAVDEAIPSLVNIQASPNPVQDWLRLDITLSRAEEITIEVFDASGRLLRTLPQGIFAQGKSNIDLGLEGLPSGLLLLRCNGEAGMLGTVKVLKQ